MGGGGVLEPRASSDFVGKSWENSGKFSSSPQNSGSHLQGIPGKVGILHHRTASFAGASQTRVPDRAGEGRTGRDRVALAGM